MAEIVRLRALLADAPEPEAKEAPRNGSNGLRRRYQSAPLLRMRQEISAVPEAPRGPVQSPSGSQPVGQNPAQDEQGLRPGEKQEDTLSRDSSLGGDSPVKSADLPLAPANRFPREEAANEVLDLIERVGSVALFGPVGVGKTFLALDLLHHDRTKAKFGENRYFMPCGNLTNSLESFLERLSDTIGTNVAQLQSSRPLIILLDGADSILDPLAPGSKDISTTIEEIGNYEHVCLLTTSRINPDIEGFHWFEIPTLPEDGARDAFYTLSNLPRSSAVDDLIAGLDFHPLSIALIAKWVHENNWDEQTLLKAWRDENANALRATYHQKLSEIIEPVFLSPTIHRLGSTVRGALEAIAAFPSGVEECELEGRIAGAGEVINILCKFFLVYRQDGFVKMLSPIRSYFLGFTPAPAQAGEIAGCDADCMPGAWLPAYGNKAPHTGPSSPTTLDLEAPPSESWIRGLPETVKRRLLALFSPWAAPTILDPQNALPASS